VLFQQSTEVEDGASSKIRSRFRPESWSKVVVSFSYSASSIAGSL
jgi:hypothetical protein